MSILKKITNRLKPGPYIRKIVIFIDKNLFDLINGTDTAQAIRKNILFDEKCKNANVEYMNDYVATYTSRINAALKKLIQFDGNILNYTFFDLGSGKGKVLILAERFGFKKIYGVEISPELNSICKENLKKVKSKYVTLLEQDASSINIGQESCVFYIYNSFERPLLEKVLDNIYSSWSASTTEMYIVYIEPRSLIDNSPIDLDREKYSLVHIDSNQFNPFHIYKLNRG